MLVLSQTPFGFIDDLYRSWRSVIPVRHPQGLKRLSASLTIYIVSYFRLARQGGFALLLTAEQFLSLITNPNCLFFHVSFLFHYFPFDGKVPFPLLSTCRQSLQSQNKNISRLRRYAHNPQSAYLLPFEFPDTIINYTVFFFIYCRAQSQPKDRHIRLL